MTAKAMKDMGMERASHIATGFAGWKADGLAVVDYDTWNACG